MARSVYVIRLDDRVWDVAAVLTEEFVPGTAYTLTEPASTVLVEKSRQRLRKLTSGSRRRETSAYECQG